jgi:hypothetical protein
MREWRLPDRLMTPPPSKEKREWRRREEVGRQGSGMQQYGPQLTRAVPNGEGFAPPGSRAIAMGQPVLAKQFFFWTHHLHMEVGCPRTTGSKKTARPQPERLPATRYQSWRVVSNQQGGVFPSLRLHAGNRQRLAISEYTMRYTIGAESLAVSPHSSWD